MHTEKCPSCGVSRPLSDFRRWLGNKKIRSAVCCKCHPRKTPRTMSPRQRINEAAHGRQHLLVMQVMNDQARVALRRRLSEKLTDHQSRRRKEAWHLEVRQRLINQTSWAKRMVRESDPTLVALGQGYLEVLAHILGETSRLAARTVKGTPIYPTERERNPRTYIDDATYARLTDLYAQAGDAFMRRQFKEPDFVNWPQPAAVRRPGRPKGGGGKKSKGTPVPIEDDADEPRLY